METASVTVKWLKGYVTRMQEIRNKTGNLTAEI
jgi:hypothetical protein